MHHSHEAIPTKNPLFLTSAWRTLAYSPMGPPRCAVHWWTPLLSNFIRNRSKDPALVFPSRELSVYPATQAWSEESTWKSSGMVAKVTAGKANLLWLLRSLTNCWTGTGHLVEIQNGMQPMSRGSTFVLLAAMVCEATDLLFVSVPALYPISWCPCTQNITLWVNESQVVDQVVGKSHTCG